MKQQMSYYRKSPQVCQSAAAGSVFLNGLSRKSRIRQASTARRAVLWLYLGFAVAALIGAFL